jgi:hypothetical protein
LKGRRDPATYCCVLMTSCFFRLALVGSGLLLPPLALSGDEPASGEETRENAQILERRAQTQALFKADVAPFIRTFCIECHGNRRTKGDLNFEPAIKAPGEASASRKWVQAAANVHAGDMPPESADQPNPEERERFLAALGQLKYLSERDPGPFVIRRLTKTEFGNTLRDLLGVSPDLAAGLPDEVPGEGYLNSLSPMQTEQFLGIADAVLDEVFSADPHRAAHANLKPVHDAAAGSAAARGAAKKLLQKLLPQAYRRPPQKDEIATLLRVYDLGLTNDLDHTGAVRLMLKALLVSPQFLFITPAREVSEDQAIAPVDDYQLASRLSYLFWATMPDAELFDLASKARLRDPEVLRAQVLRLLDDARSRAFFDGFGRHWLGLDKLPDKPFDREKFPGMTAALRQAMVEEARLFFDRLIRENQSVSKFVDDDRTHLNGVLAELYGLSDSVTGPEMREVRLNDPNRGGLLGMPAVLAATSFPNRTSPVNRGVWVLERLLGEHVPPAPANVPVLEDQPSNQVATLTLRERTELHRSNAVCANCHRILDPIGFGLENFDAIGRWRERDDSSGRVDAAGELPGGGVFASPAELKAILAGRQDAIARNLASRLLAYALCRPLRGYDEIVLDQIMPAVADDGYRLQTLIAEVVLSYPFLHRRVRD